MKPRQKPIAPMGARGFTVAMGPALGSLAFRAPSYALIGRLNEFMARYLYDDDRDGDTVVVAPAEADAPEETARIPSDRWTRGYLPYAAAVIGCAWAHDTRELSTPPLPTTSIPTDDELYVYGAAVADELQTEGWPMLAITSLGARVVGEIRARYRTANEAAKLADFLPAQADTSIGTS